MNHSELAIVLFQTCIGLLNRSELAMNHSELAMILHV